MVTYEDWVSTGKGKLVMEMDRLRVFVYEFLCECGLLALFTLYPLFLSTRPTDVLKPSYEEHA